MIGIGIDGGNERVGLDTGYVCAVDLALQLLVPRHLLALVIGEGPQDGLGQGAHAPGEPLQGRAGIGAFHPGQKHKTGF